MQSSHGWQVLGGNFKKAPLYLQSCGPATQWKTGRTTKKGKKWEKRGKFAPIENGEKMAEKYRKTGKLARFSIFSVFFGHFFPIFDRGKFSTFFPFFSLFCRSARFPLCSRPARLQHYTQKKLLSVSEEAASFFYPTTSLLN